MPTPLDHLKAAYTAVCAKIADALANPKPNYTVDGVTVDRQSYYRALLDQEESLRKIPGVAPATNPVFTHTSVAR